MSRFALAVEPRRWQRLALQAWSEAGHRGIVQVVTGGGKTVFAELCVSELASAYLDLCIVIVVPTLALLDQWYVCLREELGLSDEEIATWSGRGRPTTVAFANLMVVNTARTTAERLQELRPGPKFLVVDECHRVGSPENARALRGNYIATLGMSATPEREYDEGFASFVQPALGPIVYRYDLNDAGRDGILSEFELVNVEVALLPDEEARYSKLSRRIGMLASRTRGDAAQLRLEHLLRQRARVSALATMRIPVAVSLLERHRGARSMIFHEDIAAAERIKQILKERGHSVTIYHSKLSSSVRQDNLRLYRKGVFDVLVSCRALDEGINIPETQVAVIASASASLRQRVQRLGRVLRSAPGKSHATIYSIYATKAESERLHKEAVNLTAAASVSWMAARGDGRSVDA